MPTIEKSKLTLILGTHGAGNTHKSESWYFDKKTGSDLLKLVNDIASARAKLLGQGAGVKAVRVSQYVYDPSKVVKPFVLQGKRAAFYNTATGGPWSPAANQWGIAASNAQYQMVSAAFHSVGLRAVITFTGLGGPQSNDTLGFTPLVLTLDPDSEFVNTATFDTANAALTTNYRAYANVLYTNVAQRLLSDVPSVVDPIIEITKDTTTGNAVITLEQNSRTSAYQVNQLLHLGGMIAGRKKPHLSSNPLAGNKVIQRINADDTAGTIDFMLRCTSDFQGAEPCRARGFAYALTKSFINFYDAKVYAGGRKSRGNFCRCA